MKAAEETSLKEKIAQRNDLKDTLAAYDRIRGSEVRVSPLFDRAAIEATTLEQRIARERK